jgi:hypothetical protein
MVELLRLLLGVLIALILHESTHYAAIVHYKIRIKAIVFTWWTAFGFLVENKDFLKNMRTVAVIYFCPLLWSLLYFIDTKDTFFWAFPIANIAGGIGDLYFFIRLARMPVTERIKWADKIDKKLLKGAVWKKLT